MRLSPLLVVGVLAAPILAQPRTATAAIVAVRNAGAPATRLVHVDLVARRVASIGRFTADGLAPLAMRVDRVNRDVILALDQGSASRIVRLRLAGLRIAAERVIGTVPGTVTDLELALGDQIVAAVGGSFGGLHRLPRNGGSSQRIATRARTSAVFNGGPSAFGAILVQSGAAGPPVVDPRAERIDLRTGQSKGRASDMSGYRPLGITGVVMLPTAIGHTLFSNEDGSVGLGFVFQKPASLQLSPPLPAGGAASIRLDGTITPVVLGGRSHPFLKTFVRLDHRPQTWRIVSPALPGDPVDFDLVRTDAHTVHLGEPCARGNLLHMSATGTPRLGNARFQLTVHGAPPRQALALALGVSDQRFGRLSLPLGLPGGCELHVSPNIVVGHRATDRGFAAQNLPIPNLPGLTGGVLFGQWVQPTPAGLGASAALAVHVGR